MRLVMHFEPGEDMPKSVQEFREWLARWENHMRATKQDRQADFWAALGRVFAEQEMSGGRHLSIELVSRRP